MPPKSFVPGSLELARRPQQSSEVVPVLPGLALSQPFLWLKLQTFENTQ
ncbi:hypothetical protein ES703_121260 [subsurface metagenome]